MDQFERQFEHLDVQTQTMDEAMSGATTLTVPEVLYVCVCVMYNDVYMYVCTTSCMCVRLMILMIVNMHAYFVHTHICIFV